MGVEIIRLGGDRERLESQIKLQDLAAPHFQTMRVPSPAMSVWLMSLVPGRAIFPWWKYRATIDQDLEALGQAWAIPNQQSLFDCLFLSHLVKFAGGNLHVVFPGCIKTTGWGTLRPIDQETYSRGQSCIYHLSGSFASKFSINWVPYWEPQSLVRNPSFGSLWRLFAANEGDQSARCLTLFSVSQPRMLPEIVNLLISKDEQRSEKLAEYVDWFGMFSSPTDSDTGTSAVLYTKRDEVMLRLETMQAQVAASIQQAQTDLLNETFPRTALRILSRQIAL